MASMVVPLAPGTVAVITATYAAALEAAHVPLVDVAPVTTAPLSGATLDATAAAAPVLLDCQHRG